MAAPLPPPAKPPMRAPSPAPPPIMTAERLPLPFCSRLTAAVCTWCGVPPTVTEVRATRSTAPPLNRPRGAAWTTVPSASAPEGITVAPPTTTGAARVAGKLSPLLLILEPTACPRRTVSTVPAGTTTGLASAARRSALGAGWAPGLAGWEEVLAASEEADGPPLSFAGCGLLQDTSIHDRDERAKIWSILVINKVPLFELHVRDNDVNKNEEVENHAI